MLAVRVGEKVEVAVTLAVFRGAVVRNPKVNPQNQKIRVSKPIPVELPAACTRLLHVVRMDHQEGQGEFTASCCSEVLIMPVVNQVLGELGTHKVHASPLRVHVVLSSAASKALTELRKVEHRDLGLIPEETAEPSSATAPAATCVLPATTATTATTTFNDRSFSRNSLDAAVPEFLGALKRDYAAKGISLTDENGQLLLKVKGKNLAVPWAVLVKQVPSYFLHLCGTSRGHRFSSQVFTHLMGLMPDARHSDSLMKIFGIRFCFILPVFHRTLTTSYNTHTTCFARSEREA